MMTSSSSLLSSLRQRKRADGGYDLTISLSCINGLSADFTVMTIHAPSEAEVGYSDGAIPAPDEVLLALDTAVFKAALYDSVLAANAPTPAAGSNEAKQPVFISRAFDPMTAHLFTTPPAAEGILERLQDQIAHVRLGLDCRMPNTDSAVRELIVRASEAASLISSLTAERDALHRERAILIKTKRDQLATLTTRAETAEAALATAREALEQAYDFLGGVNGAVDIREAIIASLKGDSTP